MLDVARVLHKAGKARQRLGIVLLYERCVAQFPNVDARLLAVSMSMLYRCK